MYYIYMLRCEDNSIYTGITNDIKRRWEEHSHKDEKGAKYTKGHNVQKIEALWIAEDRALASKLEYHIKELKKEQKEELLINHKLEDVLSDRIDITKYKLVEDK